MYNPREIWGAFGGFFLCLRGAFCLVVFGFFSFEKQNLWHKKSWLVGGVAVLWNLSKRSSDYMLTEPRVISFPRPEKARYFQSSGAVDARLFPSSMCSGTFQKQTNPELPNSEPRSSIHTASCQSHLSKPVVPVRILVPCCKEGSSPWEPCLAQVVLLCVCRFDLMFQPRSHSSSCSRKQSRRCSGMRWNAVSCQPCA